MNSMLNISVELCLLASLSLTVCLAFSVGPNQNMEFTFLLPAGSSECFYQTTVMSDTRMQVEYQVIAGSSLGVGFAIISPKGYRLVSDFRRSDGIHMVDLLEVGEYQLCFDNSFSKLSEKMVFFRVIIDGKSSSGGGQDEWLDVDMPAGSVEYKLEDIRASMELVYWQLERSRQVQTALRAFEARDRYLLEDNLWRVSFWSCLNLLVMLAVAATQIYTLRRLFR
uniref:GOLD domain-containing protein n=1 Tax=Mola mola TaxID=94237 RepID=A0A3Q3WD42_MOLML